MSFNGNSNFEANDSSFGSDRREQGDLYENNQRSGGSYGGDSLSSANGRTGIESHGPGGKDSFGGGGALPLTDSFGSSGGKDETLGDNYGSSGRGNNVSFGSGGDNLDRSGRTDAFNSESLGPSGNDSYGGSGRPRDNEFVGGLATSTISTESYGVGGNQDSSHGGGKGNHSFSGQSGSGGDSKVGKLMEKTGDMLNSDKLEAKGREKREEAGFGRKEY